MIVFRNIPKFFKEALRRFREDEASRFGAAIAYYSVFSLVPLLLVAMMIAGFFLGADTVREEILRDTTSYLGDEGARFLDQTLKTAREERSGGLAFLGIFLILLGAGAVFRELKEALHQIFDLEPERGGVLAFFRKNLFLFCLVLAVGFLLLASLALSAFLSVANRFFSELLSLPGVFWQILNFFVSLGLLTGVFALVYRYVPNRRLSWHSVRFGALVTALLFTAGKSVIGFYLAHAEPASAYGAAGTLVLILLWAYYSSQIILFGAELTAVYATQAGILAHRAEAVRPSSGPPRRKNFLAKVATFLFFFFLRRFLKRLFRR